MTTGQALDEGEINIDLFPGSPEPVKIGSSRPLHVSRIFIGKSPQQVNESIPLLFNVCATAQARAGLLAMQRAMDLVTDPQTECARDILLLMENAREHLLRIMVDWPRLFDGEIDTDMLPGITRLLPATSQALFASGQAFAFDSRLQPNRAAIDELLNSLRQLLGEQLFALPLETWLAIDNRESLIDWAGQTTTLAASTVDQIYQRGWAALGQTSVQPLPQLEQNLLIKKLLDDTADGFIQSPTWNGDVCETTAYARQLDHPLIRSLRQEYANGLLTRWIARLVELALIPQQLQALLDELEQPGRRQESGGPGLAAVEAARGRLVHYAIIENQQVSQYRILAPTEWNFHPQGLIGQSLGHLLQQAADNPEQAARCLINVIDPCVGYQLALH